jgi:hypothetical protein
MLLAARRTRGKAMRAMIAALATSVKSWVKTRIADFQTTPLNASRRRRARAVARR